MELLETAVTARLIGLEDQTTEAEEDNVNEESPAVKSTNSNGELGGGEEVSKGSVVDGDVSATDNNGTNPEGGVVNEEVMHEEGGGVIDTMEEDEDKKSADNDTPIPMMVLMG